MNNLKCKKLTIPEAISLVADAVRKLLEQKEKEFEWRKSHHGLATKQDLEEMENRMAIKVSEIKAAVATASRQNKEAFAEIGTKVADLNKQIADLIAGVGDPTVTDEVFEADLRSLATDAQALADIVPGNPTPPEPPVPA